ncbi:class I SAM-dependent methyltransferase [Nitrospira sp. T9]|uniref:class I SAM-dependent methyltransferase n=1 Tax=unclassified Nitrospira TaxID=2652172 RepID=UPI003F94D863
MESKLKQLIKSIPGARSAYRWLVRIFNQVSSRMKSTEGIFTEIYKENYWRGKSSVSGQGSDLEQTQTIVKELPILLNDLNISTMLDIPCGDFFWMKMVDLKSVHYTGADIVGELVERNQQLYQTDNIVFTKLNLLRSDLPKVDLIFCRDCLGHFSFSNIIMALKNMSRSESSYLLTTTFPERKANCDIVTGQWRPLNLEAGPFHFPPPQSLLVEHCTQKTKKGEYKDKSLGLWKISDVEEILKKGLASSLFLKEKIVYINFLAMVASSVGI